MNAIQFIEAYSKMKNTTQDYRSCLNPFSIASNMSFVLLLTCQTYMLSYNQFSSPHSTYPAHHEQMEFIQNSCSFIHSVLCSTQQVIKNPTSCLLDSTRWNTKLNTNTMYRIQSQNHLNTMVFKFSRALLNG